MTLALLLSLALVTGDPEAERIRRHLDAVVAQLRAADHDLDDATLARRDALIDALEVYAATGAFPKNHVYPGRRPVFIDPHGTLCAVGHLVAVSAGRDAA